MAEALNGVEAVMHFAASAYVGESVANPRKYFRNNVEAALKLLDAVLASSVRLFIFSSTCATYGIPQTLPITESEALRRPSILMERPNCFSNTRLLPMLSRTECDLFPCVTSMRQALMPMDRSANSTTLKRI
jgi:UDP-glucose 4-epimerase